MSRRVGEAPDGAFAPSSPLRRAPLRALNEGPGNSPRGAKLPAAGKPASGPPALASPLRKAALELDDVRSLVDACMHARTHG